MDLDALFHRDSLFGAPITLLFRPADPEAFDFQATLANARRLLNGRASTNEVLLLVPKAVPVPLELPARSGGVRIRTMPQPSTGSSLGSALERCRNPIVVLLDDRCQLTEGVFTQLLQALEQADIVVGKRPGRQRWRPLETLLRWWFSIPVVEPLFAVKVLRRAAIQGIVLETDDRMVDFELIAKSTFRTTLLDEVEVPGVERAPGLLAGFLAGGKKSWKLLFLPSFGTAAPEVQHWRASFASNPSVAPAGTRWNRQQPIDAKSRGIAMPMKLVAVRDYGGALSRAKRNARSS